MVAAASSPMVGSGFSLGPLGCSQSPKVKPRAAQGRGGRTIGPSLIDAKWLHGSDDASILREIQAALNGLKFGSVEITVHNGQVVQIERKEKFRLQAPAGKNA